MHKLCREQALKFVAVCFYHFPKGGEMERRRMWKEMENPIKLIFIGKRKQQCTSNDAIKTQGGCGELFFLFKTMFLISFEGSPYCVYFISFRNGGRRRPMNSNLFSCFHSKLFFFIFCMLYFQFHSLPSLFTFRR